ncbi:MAG: undecaprenyl-phosphate alpha-N-acetylglucosaminyl 1-phosphate transferase [Candidatus Dojkabacteria bacterium]|nr:MAG: undecaprenyl-phosphate alpha-N-acetylglucosaminyl 1-phosphate transferase [Candidatus Dojkabacteria bacterium]
MLTFNFDPYLQVLPNFIIAFFMGLLLTPILRFIGLKFGFATLPASQSRPDERGNNVKLHKITISRLGEFAMVIPLIILMWRDLNFDSPQIFGITLSIIFIAVIGALDSKYDLSEFVKLFALFFSSVILVFTGTIIDIHSIIDLRQYDILINNPITLEKLSIISAFATILWICIVSTALSYVGGVDGLSEGTSAIAILMLTLIGIRNGDTVTIVIGSLCLGGLCGLIPYNFYPKTIMSEHLIYGLVIAILAIITKGKIATSLLIITIPLIDFIFVFVDRSIRYFKSNQNTISIKAYLHALGTPEKNHLHHKLLQLGLSHPQIAILQYVAYGILGFIALAFSGLHLTMAILGSCAVIVLIYYYIHRRLKENVK